MSNIWSKGPVCGIDNCPSRLYRSADGRKICQFGHVRENEVEINDEEDDNFVVTRRLKMPSQRLTQATQNDEILFGVQGQRIFFNCYQFLLRKSCDIVVNEFGIANGDELLKAVRLNWLKYLNLTNLSRSGFNYEKKPRMITAVSLIALSCHALQIPVYVCDFYQMICLNKLPYMQAASAIPAALKKGMPTYYLRAFTVDFIPAKGELYKEMLGLNKILDVGVELNFAGLVFKLLKELVLPLEIFKITDELIGLAKSDLRFKKNKMVKSLHHSPELRVIAFTIVAIKMFFAQRMELMQKWVNILDKVPNKTFEHIPEVKSLLTWNDDQIDDYLNLISKFVLADDLPEPAPAKRRVFENFNPTFIDRSAGKNFYAMYDDIEIVKTIQFNEIHELLITKVSSLVGITPSELQSIHDRTFRELTI